MVDSDEHALLLQISYDLRRLQTQGQAATGEVDKHLSAMERRAKKTARELEETFSFEHVNFKFGFDKALLAATDKVAEEGSKGLGVFGGALEALGPIGLAAGASVAAGMMSIEKAMHTAEWAEELERASKTLGLTTTQLQEFDFVAKSTGIPIDQMRESLGGLQRTIGLVESGLARSMQTKAFTDGLKITPEQLRGWGDLEHQLPHILEALSKLNAQERQAIAQRLKVDPEVLTSLIEARERIDDLVGSAHKYGIVMSDEAVKRTAEAAEKMHVASAVIDGELKIAFADLAPLIANAATSFADVTKNISDFVRGVQETLKPLDDMIARVEHLTGLKPGAVGSAAGAATKTVLQQIPGLGALVPLLDQVRARGAAARAADDRKNTQDDQARRKQLAGPLPAELSTPAAKKPRQDHTSGLATTAAEDLASADRALQEAMKALTFDIDKRAQFEVQAINDAAAKEQAKLAADRKKLLADETISGKASDIAQHKIEQAQAEAEQTRLLKIQLVQRQLDVQRAQQAEAMRQIQATGEIDFLRAQQSLWQTAEQRRALALKIFDLEEQDRQAVLKAQILDAQRAENKAEEARLTAQLANQQRTESTRREATSQQNPGGAWDQWVQDAQRSTADVKEAFDQMKVAGIDRFNQSLFDSQGRLNSFGQIARNISRQFITDFEQFSVKSVEAGLFGGSGDGRNPLSNIGASVGGLFGLGGKGGKAGDKKPAGTATDPIFTKSADQALGGAGGGNPLGALFGGSSGGLGGLFGGGDAASAAAGATGGGGLQSSLMSIGSIFGFDKGGDFEVAGAGGVDRNLAMMRLSRGEHVSIRTAAQQREAQTGGVTIHQNFNFPGANPDGFMRTRRQWSRQAHGGMALARG